MSLCVVTINNRATPLDRKGQETTFIERGLILAAQAIDSAKGNQLSGNILDDGGVTIGSWNYTPQASLP
ncbi:MULTISPECIES: hypothetical protein [unclassified Bradyrhizobium]